jgi:hypothetical protein
MQIKKVFFEDLRLAMANLNIPHSENSILIFAYLRDDTLPLYSFIPISQIKIPSIAPKFALISTSLPQKPLSPSGSGIRN